MRGWVLDRSHNRAAICLQRGQNKGICLDDLRLDQDRDLLHLWRGNCLHRGWGKGLQRAIGCLCQHPLGLYCLHLLLNGDRLYLGGCHQALDLRLKDLKASGCILVYQRLLDDPCLRSGAECWGDHYRLLLQLSLRLRLGLGAGLKNRSCPGCGGN